MIEKYTKFILYGILVLAAIFRLYAVNWDQGYHLHPDERAIVLKVVEMRFPQNVSEFFNAESSWNPKFFAYGSFPFYLLRISGDIAGSFLDPNFAEYAGINLVGRVISAFFDLGTILLLYFLAKRFFNTAIGLLSAFFYAVSVLPIQLSHFYAVDTILTFFMLAILYLAIKLEEERKLTTAVFCGICFALAIATKVSSILLLFPIAIAFLYVVVNTESEPRRIKTSIQKVIKLLFVFIISTIVSFLITSPYAFLDHKRFIGDTMTQSEMTKDAFVFPYTLQYALKIPYFHEIKNIFFYGLGPILGILSFAGVMYFLYRTIKERKLPHQARDLIILSIFIVYFLTVGGFKVGFMRYMLPLYPLFALFAAIFVYYLGKRLRKTLHAKLFAISSLLFTIFLLVWPLSFMEIYTRPNTRVSATDWILQNIPRGQIIAIEHWDDSLPLKNFDQYRIVTLPMYEPDTDIKWQGISEMLTHTDYIIIASNRLYTPLMKLTDCESLPASRCYVQTATYYESLFSEKGDFRKVAEFTNYPTIPFTSLSINDQGADESFTVYDHPKVMIFKKKGL